MATVRCPACDAAADVPAGASATCACGADYWRLHGVERGEPFTGVLHDRAGAPAVLWSALAATGVLAALLGILAAEVWGVIWLVQRVTA